MRLHSRPRLTLKITSSRWLLIFFVLAGLFSGCGTQTSEKKTGAKAPDFTLPRLPGDSQVTLSKINGEKPVLLAFWASWCPSCVEEIPALNEMQAKYGDRNFEILSVNVQEPREDVMKFMKEKEIAYSVALDEDGEVASSYGLVGLPASVLLAKGGEILYYGFTLPENPEQYFEPGTV